MKRIEIKPKENILHEPPADYEKAEDDLLRESLKQDYTQRFHTMTRLMKMGIMLQNAAVKHKKMS